MYRMMCCLRMKRSNRSKWKHSNTINVHDERKKWMFAVVMMLNKYIDVNSSSKPHNFFSIIFVIIWLKVTHRNHEWTWETTATSSTKYCEREKNLSFVLIFLVTRHLDGDSVFFLVVSLNIFLEFCFLLLHLFSALANFVHTQNPRVNKSNWLTWNIRHTKLRGNTLFVCASAS